MTIAFHSSAPFPATESFPIDYPPLLVLSKWRSKGWRSALLTVVAIDGRSPRSVGAQMVVNEHGDMHGYLTGGCLEGELRLVAQHVIRNGQNELRRYGKGSPYIDLRLPCGSGIDIYFDQAISDATVHESARLMVDRMPFLLTTDMDGGSSQIEIVPDGGTGIAVGIQQHRFRTFVKPSLRLNLYGAGSAALQLALFAKAANLQVEFFTTDALTKASAEMFNLTPRMLGGPLTLPPSDPWTASVVMFHEHEREIPLLIALLDRPGFYLGAIGSRSVAQQRADALIHLGIARERVETIVMQAGLVRQARSATELGVGVLAEILDRARELALI